MQQGGVEGCARCLADIATVNAVLLCIKALRMGCVTLRWLFPCMSQQLWPRSPQQGVRWHDMARQSGGLCVLPGQHRQRQPMLPRGKGLQRHGNPGELLL